MKAKRNYFAFLMVFIVLCSFLFPFGAYTEQKNEIDIDSYTHLNLPSNYKYNNVNNYYYPKSNSNIQIKISAMKLVSESAIKATLLKTTGLPATMTKIGNNTYLWGTTTFSSQYVYIFETLSPEHTISVMFFFPSTIEVDERAKVTYDFLSNILISTKSEDKKTNIELNKTKVSIYAGQNLKLKVKGTQQKIKWSSSDDKIATVDSTGKVTAKKKGKVVISAKVDDTILKCQITVNKTKLNKSKVTITKGQKIQLSVVDIDKNITWISSDSDIAVVNKKGVVTANNKGKATITAKVGDVSLNCEVKVK